MEEVTAYITNDGELFLNENDAIEHEKSIDKQKIVNALVGVLSRSIDEASSVYIANVVYDKRDVIMNILTNPRLLRTE